MNFILPPIFSVFLIILFLNSYPDVNAEIVVIDQDMVIANATVIHEDHTWQILSGIKLMVIDRLENNGSIENNGILENNGWGTGNNGLIVNNGSIENNGIIYNERGGINNLGMIDNLQEFYNTWKLNNYGIFNNLGTVTNNPGGDIYNKNNFTNIGAIINNCQAQVRGNEISGIPVTDNCNPPGNVPILTVPKKMIIKEATEYDGAQVFFEISAIDDEDGILTPNCTKKPQDMFSIRITTVTCSVEDSDGNFVEDEFSVMVQDTTPPEMSIQSNLTITTTELMTKVGYSKPTSVDTVDGYLEPICYPSRDHFFQIGETKVSCEVSDNSGNISKDSFILTLKQIEHPIVESNEVESNEVESNEVESNEVESNEVESNEVESNEVEPEIQLILSITSPDDITIEATSKITPISEIILGNPIIQGTDDPNLKITHDAPSNFTLGITSVNWSVVESNGNSATNVQNITLIDSTKPEITISSPIEGLQINSNSLIISGISHDEIGVETIAIIINNNKIFEESFKTNEWSFMLSDLDKFDSDTLNIVAKAVDIVGNSNTDSVTVKVEQDVTNWDLGFIVLFIITVMVIGIIVLYKLKSNSEKSNQTKSDYFHPVEK